MKSISWHSGGTSHERRQWGPFCLELLPILSLSVPLSLSLSLSSSLTSPSLSLPLSLLWNPTAVLIPRILLQGLISFPFLKRLFKYCYIYSQQQQQHSHPPSQAADWGENSYSFPLLSSSSADLFAVCPLCVSFITRVDTVCPYVACSLWELLGFL